jgi:hypothetical protein
MPKKYIQKNLSSNPKAGLEGGNRNATRNILKLNLPQNVPKYIHINMLKGLRRKMAEVKTMS